MKKCKYHCDYGDGENCHYENGCVLIGTADMCKSEICTECMVCGETIHLGQSRSELVPRMCDKCKDAIMFIKRMRSKETVSVVRCKDCKHYDADTQSCLDGLDGIFQPDWFCADGERAET